MCDILPELLHFNIECQDVDKKLFSNEECDFHRRQHGAKSSSQQFEMLDTTGDIYMQIGNQTIFFVNKDN